MSGDRLDLAGDTADVALQGGEKGVTAIHDLADFVGAAADIVQAMGEIAALAPCHGVGDLRGGMADRGGKATQHECQEDSAKPEHQKCVQRQHAGLMQFLGQIDLDGESAEHGADRHMVALQAVVPVIILGFQRPVEVHHLMAVDFLDDL